MRELFPGYYRPTPEQFEQMWRDAVFVLDANVMLNLYRYPESARNELLLVLDSVKARLWIPYQAAHEFQRNRASVISEQKKRFHEVREITNRSLNTLRSELEKLRLRERHSLIDPEKFLSGLSPLYQAFSKEVEDLEKQHIDVHQQDDLRARIDDLLGDRIGPAPAQQWMDELRKEAVARFSARLPPGFADQSKSKGDDASYIHAGVLYERQYGDLIVWKQLLEFASGEPKFPIIFVTDDEKDDWWQIIDSQGKKTLGPRPELIEEMSRVGSVSLFYMYKTHTFLQQAKTYLASQVSDDAIDQVEQVATTVSEKANAAAVAHSIRQSVFGWLSKRFAGSEVDETIFPDFTIDHPDGHRTFVEIVRPVRTRGLTFGRILAELDSLRSNSSKSQDEFEVIVPCRSPSLARNLAGQVEAAAFDEGCSVTVGVVSHQNGEFTFTPQVLGQPSLSLSVNEEPW